MINQKIYISIGSDCYNTITLKNNKVRNVSLPFDWIVTYNGISKILKNNFKNYFDNVKLDDTKENFLFNKEYNILFIHNTFPDDIEQLNRRIIRFNDILSNNNQVIFIRKSHANHHHDEIKIYFDCNIKNDIEDCNELDNYLQQQYPNLNYIIIIILICEKCFDKNKIYNSESKNIIIINKVAKNKYERNNFHKIYDQTIKEIINNY